MPGIDLVAGDGLRANFRPSECVQTLSQPMAESSLRRSDVGLQERLRLWQIEASLAYALRRVPRSGLVRAAPGGPLSPRIPCATEATTQHPHCRQNQHWKGPADNVGCCHLIEVYQGAHQLRYRGVWATGCATKSVVRLSPSRNSLSLPVGRGFSSPRLARQERGQIPTNRSGSGRKVCAVPGTDETAT